MSRTVLQLLVLVCICLGNCAHSECFNFLRPIRKPLYELPLTPGQTEVVKSGVIPDEGVFAAIHTIVNYPFAEVKKEVDDPYFTRNPDNTSVKPESEKSKIFSNYQHVHVKVKVFAFVSIGWDEDWATEVIAGTKELPTGVLYSYEKITGTTHLRKKCGNIRLKQMTPNETDVFWYENVDAAKWNEESAREHLVNTIHEKFPKKGTSSPPSEAPKPDVTPAPQPPVAQPVTPPSK